MNAVPEDGWSDLALGHDLPCVADGLSLPIQGCAPLKTSPGLYWPVLVADRDPEVHTAVDAALGGRILFGRVFQVLHAWSGSEARSFLVHESGMAVVVLDQTLDNPDNWLDLANFIRFKQTMTNVHIVLHTDPLRLPALETLLRLNITDRRDKPDLVGERLVAIVATAVRYFIQSCTIDASRHDQAMLKRLTDHAYFDPLVRLPNRAMFVERVDECVRQGICNYMLALVDIDDFSAANEMMGHRFGDRLLEMVSQRLARSLPPDILLARVGPDTFGVLGCIEQAYPQQLLDCVELPLSIEGTPYKVSMTCGYVLLVPDDKRSAADQVKDATIALKRAKRDHRGRFLQYLDSMGTEAHARALLLSDLRNAIDHGLLFLVYQPQIDLKDGSLIGLEALTRWRTNAGAFIPPDQFIPVAEHSGLIVALGRWVMNTACKAMRKLLDAGVAPQRMAINVSMVQLRDPEFLSMVQLVLASSCLQGAHIELEITESVAVLPTQALEFTLNALRKMGITIAIDDFGTGYSSLSCLERLPLDRIKIDRSFISELNAPRGARIAEMVAQLGLKLDLQVLAEGIEDAATLQSAISIGCHQGQGYHIAIPMSEPELLEWLQLHFEGQGAPAR